MHNGKIIKTLLKERGLLAKDLLKALDLDKATGLRPFVDRDIKASRLEQVADFFGVPIDTFFIRNRPPHISVIGNDNNVACYTVGALEERSANLQALLEEKDKRIELLENMNELLMKQLQNK